jgi:3-oxoadipate enol-lactonase
VPFIDANGVSLHYELAGARGPCVALLHELGGTLNSWNKVAPRLAARYRVLRYDQRG